MHFIYFTKLYVGVPSVDTVGLSGFLKGISSSIAKMIDSSVIAIAV